MELFRVNSVVVLVLYPFKGIKVVFRVNVRESDFIYHCLQNSIDGARQLLKLFLQFLVIIEVCLLKIGALRFYLLGESAFFQNVLKFLRTQETMLMCWRCRRRKTSITSPNAVERTIDLVAKFCYFDLVGTFRHESLFLLFIAFSILNFPTTVLYSFPFSNFSQQRMIF